MATMSSQTLIVRAALVSYRPRQVVGIIFAKAVHAETAVRMTATVPALRDVQMVLVP
jgi:hypothetical protein